MKNLVMRASWLAVTAYAAASAQAAPLVNQWSYSGTSTWVTSGAGAPTWYVNPASGGGHDATSTRLRWWGTAGRSQGSTLTISPASTSGTVNTGSTTPAAGPIITHVNKPLNRGDLLETATIRSTLTLQALDPASATQQILTLNYAISFAETDNETDPANCGFPSTSGCDDIFVLKAGSLNNAFNYDGNSYYMTVVSLLHPLTVLPAATCAQAGEAAGCLGFQTPENDTTPLQFGFMITAEPVSVPEPGALALAAAALAGLGATHARRRRSRPVTA